jgi:PmbA protein
MSPEALMREAGEGFLATELLGSGVNGLTGDYSLGARGFWLEKGKIAFPVERVTLAGRLQDMFAGLTPANDLTVRGSTNAPTLRIANMAVTT